MPALVYGVLQRYLICLIGQEFERGYRREFCGALEFARAQVRVLEYPNLDGGKRNARIA